MSGIEPEAWKPVRQSKVGRWLVTVGQKLCVSVLTKPNPPVDLAKLGLELDRASNISASFKKYMNVLQKNRHNLIILAQRNESMKAATGTIW
jgi:hypothetical protein